MSINHRHIYRSNVLGQNILFYCPQPEDHIQSYHVTGGFYEWEELNIIKHEVGQGATIVEVGANVGNHVIFYDKIMKAKEIIAIEPNPAAYETLKINLEINCINTVSMLFTDLGFSNIFENSRISMDERNIGGARLISEKHGPVRVVPGDMLLKNKKIDFIKIDAEDHDIEVLQGLQKTIENCRPKLFIEIYDYKYSELEKFMNDVGYTSVDSYKRYEKTTNYFLKSCDEIVCRGNHFVDQNNRDACYENMPTTLAELAIMKWLRQNENLYINKPVFHIGTGNGEFIKLLERSIVVDTLTISGLEKEKTDAMNMAHVNTYLINKHNMTELSRLTNSYDLIIDVNLKSFACCNNDFDMFFEFLLLKLNEGGKIITAMTGVDFGWNGNKNRAYTPGSDRVDPESNFRVLGWEGLMTLSEKYNLKIEKIKVENVIHHHGLKDVNQDALVDSEDIVLIEKR